MKNILKFIAIFIAIIIGTTAFIIFCVKADNNSNVIDNTTSISQEDSSPKMQYGLGYNLDDDEYGFGFGFGQNGFNGINLFWL